ncbi:MAG: helix-turn-helix domain-containing protein [Ruminococcus sp.]|nr:helix-turn-helix domain-containing protein [Ruminococcus sp.]MCM1438979.1 helix-turn-helix domain-containing protein [Roseburia sp.]
MTQSEYYEQSIAIQRIGALSVLDVEDLAVMLRVTADRIRHMISDKLIPYHKSGNRVYFRKSEIEDWQTRNRIPTAEEIESQAATRCAVNRNKRK